jgi:hypothetical protein
MQTFSGMQRSITYQNVINRLFLVVLFIGYISLSSMYLLFPPLLAVLFYFYRKALSDYDLFALVTVIVMLLIFEVEKGFWFGSTIVFFTLLSHYLLPKIEQVIRCRICLASIYVGLAYPAYWIFIWFVNKLLLLNVPTVDWHILLYMIVEFLVIAVLV